MRSKAVEPRVEALLKDFTNLRSDDKKLLLAYWRAHDGLKLDEQQTVAFLNATPAESITRARRALRDKYPGDQAAEDRRYERYIIERNDHGEEVVILRKGYNE